MTTERNPVVEAVLTDGVLTHLVTENNDHQIVESAVGGLSASAGVMSSMSAAAATNGLVTGTHRSFNWAAAVGDALLNGPADESYWGTIPEVPKLVGEGIYGFSFLVVAEPITSTATKISCELNVNGDYDGEGDSGLDHSLCRMPLLEVPIGASIPVECSGVTPFLPPDTDFAMTIRVISDGTVNIVNHKLSIWKLF